MMNKTRNANTIKAKTLIKNNVRLVFLTLCLSLCYVQVGAINYIITPDNYYNNGTTHIGPLIPDNLLPMVDSITIRDIPWTKIGEQLSDLCKTENIVYLDMYDVTGTDICFNTTSYSSTGGEIHFNGCPKLETIIFPKSAKRIGGYQNGGIFYDAMYVSCFNNCPNLKKVILPENLTTLYAFRDCPLIKEVQLPSTLKELAGFDNTAITELIIPNTVSSVVGFNGCRSLKKIKFPSNIITIAGFDDCSSLVSIEFIGEKTKLEYLGERGTGGFRRCTELTSVHIPESSKYHLQLNAGIFQGCTKLRTVEIGKGSLVGQSSVAESQGDYAGHDFEDCPIETLSIARICDFGMFEGKPIRHLTIGGDCVVGTGTYRDRKFANYDKLETLVINEMYKSPTKIPSECFKNCENLRNIIFNAPISEIEADAFNGCNNIAEVTIKSKNPPHLGSNNFLGVVVWVPKGSRVSYVDALNWSDNLILEEGANTDFVSVTVTKPGTLASEILKTGVQPSAITRLKVKGRLNDTDFSVLTSSIPALFELDLSNIDNTEIPANAFFNKRYLKSIILPNKLIKIGENAFKFCKQLRQITIPAPVTTIEEGAFESCYLLQEVSLSPNGLITIGNFAFYDCEQLEVFNMPSTVQSIGDRAFNNCRKLSSFLQIPEGMKIINDGAFQNCTSLLSVFLPTTLEEIGRSAFSGCKCLTNIILPESLKKIHTSAFANCSLLQELRFPYGLQLLGEDSFSGCNQLKAIFAPWETPLPAIGIEGWPAFSDAIFDRCILYVPIGAAGNYMIAPVWMNFTNIQEIRYTNISSLDANGQTFDVYNIQGRKVRSGATSLDGLPKGVYIVNGRKIIMSRRGQDNL